MSVFRHRATAACLALALSIALAACGKVGKPSYDATAENNGTYVQLGSIYYQLQISRELNPYATEDREYLIGLPARATSPSPSQIWYGVFLRAINMGEHAETAANDFKITDTQGNVYTPVPLNPSTNLFAWTGGVLAPRGTEPAPNTAASFAPTQAALVLFKLNNSVYNNRPLTLQVRAPGVAHVATISLDL